MTSDYDAYFKCPFYLRESGKLICCEGVVKNTCISTSFPTPDDKKTHMILCCFKVDGGNCPMAKNLFSKYGLKSLKK